jgi:glucose-1-phosphate cytidylyltransferase
MRVVIFCGGLGVRMGEATASIPKPMIPIGGRPILWHIMKYYASFGHTDFVLCLGYRAEAVKDYFLTYREAIANDFVLSNGGETVELLGRDIDDWRITFVDTGLRATIGERLKAVEPYLGDDRVFLATYGDVLTDAPLDDVIAEFHRRSKTAMLLSVRPTAVFHVVDTDDSGVVRTVEAVSDAGLRINGGYMVLRRELLDLIGPGDDLVDGPFKRLIAAEELVAYRYDGFWEVMDTLKDRQRLEAEWESGEAPWRHVGRDAPPRRAEAPSPAPQR